MSPAVSWKALREESSEATAGFAPLEAGLYNFIINDPAKIGKTGKGHPKFTINPSVESGPRAKSRIFHDFNLSDSAFANGKHFFGALAALGLNDSFFDADPSQDQIAQALQGRRFTAEVFDETGSDGVVRAKIRNITAAVAPSGLAGPGGPGMVPTMAANPGIPTTPAAPVAPQAPVAQAAPNPWDGVNAGAPAAPAAPAIPFGNNVAAPPAF